MSFDGLNLSLPAAPTTDPALSRPWPHVDQSPHVARFDCVQGILNLLPNGPDDGGLMVLDGSAAHYAELWEHFEHKKPAGGWNTRAWQEVDADMCDWLIKTKGCRWVKVCAQPGDLLLWDSRTIHYGAPPSSTNPRFAAYVCYKPASMVDDDTRRALREAFAKRQGTSHDPSCFRAKERLPPQEHHSYEEAARRPLQEPVLSQRGRRLAGLDTY